MACCYSTLINEANSLMGTFTISYNVNKYENDLFSSTYDELSKWIREALTVIQQKEELGKESELYKYIRKFRGRAGDVTLEELKYIVHNLEVTQK
jgi:hypothetical protein